MATADIDREKREKLADIIRRATANPSNVAEVADEIARDWYPMIKIDPQGRRSFVIGSGKKK